MSKVVIERPRRDHCARNSKTRKRVRRFNYDLDYNEDFDELFDDLPQRVSGSRSKYLRQETLKEPSDLLGPLQKFLRSNVGRPWDVVHSEMSKHLDKRKTTGRHVFEHVETEVTVNCYEENGLVYGYNSWGGRPQPVSGLYVHPRTGLLRSAERRYRKERSEPKERTRIRISPQNHYIRQDGVWYIAELKNYKRFVAPDEVNKPTFVDHLSLKWLILQRRQCNKKELKSAGLKNAPIR